MNHLTRRDALAAEAAPAPSTRPGAGEPDAPLTAREQAVFTLLSSHPGRLYARADILERVWGLEFGGDERVVDAYVNRVRRKLEGRSDLRIETVRGAGYRCVPADDGPGADPLPGGATRLLELVGEYGTSPAGILRALLDSVGSVPGVGGVALLRGQPGAAQVVAAVGSCPVSWPPLPVPAADASAWVAAGRAPEGIRVAGGVPALLLPLPTAAGSRLALAFAGRPGAVWEADTRALLCALARPAVGALRRALEAQAEREAHRLLSEQVQALEARALKARQDSGALLALTHLLEDARSVPEILNVSLPVLAELAGTDACAAWFPRPGGPAGAALHRTGLPVGTPDWSGSPALPGDLTVEIGEQTLTLRPFGTHGTAAREASLLLPVAARCVALALTQTTLLRALERSALTDEYTGLGNRQAFLADLHAEVAFSARHGARFAVALVDLGNIRYLNATSGYAGGNDLISRLARTLQGVTRAEDRAYRLNGATFALLLRLPPDPGGAVRGWQDRLGAALTQLRQSAPVPLDLQTSLVVCPQDAASTSELLRLALRHLSPAPLPASLPDAADQSPESRWPAHDG